MIAWYLIPCLMLAATTVRSQTGTVSEPQDKESDRAWDLKPLEQELGPLVKQHAGTATLALKVLDKENKTIGQLSWEPSKPMPTASLIKLPVMIEAYRQHQAGKLDLEATVELKESDKVPGSGILTEHFSAGTRLFLRDAIRLMIRYSDNTATNLVVDAIGLESTAGTMKELGLPDTQLHSKVYRRDTSIAPQRSQKFGLGSTTAADMLQLLGKLEAGTLVSPAACKEMLEHLEACEDDTKLARYLPAGTRIAHKTGAVNRSRTDAGIIYLGSYKILICVLTSDNEDVSWTADNAAERLIAEVGRRVTRFVARKEAPKPGPQAMAQGSHGRLVEALQRTLNAKIDSGLSIDGDFGPATAAAVRAFQQKQGLDASGNMNPETWEALGPLLTQDEPVPEPDVVNSQDLERQPALNLDSPPETTAKAWAILDLDSGEFLAEKLGDEALDIASTTKLMTALLVFELAEQDPSVLEEQITFSRRADKTIGSTSGVREGESLSVAELLYGLLLPSGNDASVALAEHFGFRLAKQEIGREYTESPAASYELFVAAMNRRAAELGMQKTYYVNPHGLTAPGHLSSAKDLAILAKHALSIARLREYVGTRQRGCRLVSIDGYSRDVVWKNTNRLLGQEGFFGVKTGTTSAAGACLISAGQHASKRRVIVVLGSANSSARYVDVKNLYRWTWAGGN